MSDGLTKMNNMMLNNGITIKSKSITFLLFGYSLTIDTLTHDIVKVLDWD